MKQLFGIAALVLLVACAPQSRNSSSNSVPADGTARLEHFSGNWDGKLDCGLHYGKNKRANARITMSIVNVEGQSLVGRISWRGGSAYRSGNSKVRFSLVRGGRYPVIGELFADDQVNRIGRRWQTTSVAPGTISAKELYKGGYVSPKCVITLNRY